jgi:hypothetical protein
MATEYVRVWTSVTTLDGGVKDTTGNAAANQGEYGNKEANHFWRQETAGGASMTSFFANERTSTVNIASAGVTAPAAQMTAWKSRVATMEASSTIGAVTYPGTAPTYARENSAGDQLPGDLTYGNYNYPMWLRAMPYSSSPWNDPTKHTSVIAGDDTSILAKVIQVDASAEAQFTGWTFTPKAGDTPANAGQTGPNARAENLWDNGSLGSSGPGIIAH